MPKEFYDSKNVLNITYSEYIHGNEIVFLDRIAEFLNVDIDQTQFDDTVSSLVAYRFSQPPMPQ